FHGGAQGPVGGEVVAAAVFRHAEGQQGPRAPADLHPRAGEDQRRVAFRLVGGRKDTAGPGSALGRGRVAGVLGEGEDPPPGGGVFLALPEPRLQGSNLQGQERVPRVGGGASRQVRDRLARAAGRLEDQRAEVRSFAERVEVVVALHQGGVGHAGGDG